MSVGNIIIIGAMKCGTTSLHSILRQHPSIVAGEKKEMNYFKDHDADQYLEQFAVDPDQHRYTLEASPAYTKHHVFDAAQDYVIPSRIARLGSKAKLIYIMRNPIDRCESHIAHNIGHGRITRESFDIRHPILTSLYASQLDIYRKYFSSDQLLLLSIDDLENNPEHAMRSIGEFLDLGWEQLRVGKPRKVRTLQGELLSDAHKREIANAVCPDMRRLVDEYGFPGAKPWIASLERWMD